MVYKEQNTSRINNVIEKRIFTRKFMSCDIFYGILIAPGFVIMTEYKLTCNEDSFE